MHETSTQVSTSERQAEQARADLAQAVARLQDRLTPAHMLSALGQSVRGAAAPLVDPLIAQTKSSSGVIMLAGAAAALVYGLGRASVSRPQPPPPAASAGPPVNGAAFERPAMDRDSPGTGPASARPAADTSGKHSGLANGAKQSGTNLRSALILSAASLAAGAAIGATLPLADSEKRFAKTQGRDIKDWVKAMLEDHKSELAGQAANAFGIASHIGTLLSVAALVAAQFKGKAESDGGNP